jgi:ribosomal protein L37AE/L43A
MKRGPSTEETKARQSAAMTERAEILACAECERRFALVNYGDGWHCRFCGYRPAEPPELPPSGTVHATVTATRVIRVDEEVLARLNAERRPTEKNYNSAIRRLMARADQHDQEVARRRRER